LCPDHQWWFGCCFSTLSIKEKVDTMRAAIVILAVLLTLPLAARAESPAMALVAGPDAVKWGPVPPSFPKGAMIAVLKLDVDKGQSFAPGGFVSMPAGMNHYAWATSETVVQVHGNGPFAIVYVNPADDPSKNP
jgi:hypothetical protein